MSAALGRKRTELVQRLLECANAGLAPEPSDLRMAEKLGIDTRKIMEVFHVANNDNEGDG